MNAQGRHRALFLHAISGHKVAHPAAAVAPTERLW